MKRKEAREEALKEKGNVDGRRDEGKERKMERQKIGLGINAKSFCYLEQVCFQVFQICHDLPGNERALPLILLVSVRKSEIFDK